MVLQKGEAGCGRECPEREVSGGFDGGEKKTGTENAATSLGGGHLVEEPFQGGIVRGAHRGTGGDLEGFHSVEDDEGGSLDEGSGRSPTALVGALAGGDLLSEEADQLAEAFVRSHGVVGSAALFGK